MLGFYGGGQSNTVQTLVPFKLFAKMVVHPGKLPPVPSRCVGEQSERGLTITAKPEKIGFGWMMRGL